MSSARFAVGDRVVFLPQKSDYNVSRGFYTVVRVMPAGSGGVSYRVKNDGDAHERVIVEAQLAPFSSARQ
ncbi:MAG: hypothetical protein INR65_07670 [Gluconacetobacter diazotrophicus]|nr:hypothetical protein [Gluconacetobacter diazotrophicus]